MILLGSDAAYLDELGRRTVTVSISRRVPHARVDFVHSAEGKGVQQAMDHLVELGHRRIVHVGGGRGPGSAGRRRAWRPAMRRHGLESQARVIPGEHTEQSGIETGESLLTEHDRGLPLPTAVLTGNDRCAWGLLMSLTRAGVDIPHDLSVVGYDDSHLSHLMPIGLTTVRQDTVLMAENAVRFAVERLEDDSLEPREAVLEPKLVARGTSGPVPKAGPERRRCRHGNSEGLRGSLNLPKRGECVRSCSRTHPVGDLGFLAVFRTVRGHAPVQCLGRASDSGSPDQCGGVASPAPERDTSLGPMQTAKERLGFTG